MTDLERTFLHFTKLVEAQKENLKNTQEQLTGVMVQLGVGTFVQDNETGLVYKIIEPDGTFTYYKKIDYKRTAKEGERGGSVLSKKEATEAGFILK